LLLRLLHIVLHRLSLFHQASQAAFHHVRISAIRWV
jgi:hypothetical protein